MSTNISLELDGFDEISKYIKKIILTNEELWKLVYYPVSSPLVKDFGEDPYDIFNEYTSKSTTGIIETHGVILFKDKDDVILNAVSPVILINYESSKNKNSDYMQDVKIEIKIIFKGNILELSDGSNRAYRIGQIIDNSLNNAKINSVNKARRESFEQLSLNEENYGFKLIYQVIVSNFNDEIKIYEHYQEDDTYGIARESYNLLTTTNPILVDIQTYTDSKTEKKYYGYDLEITLRMICDIIPEITESTIIKYDSKYYKIQKIIKYEDYLDCALVITWNAVINE